LDHAGVPSRIVSLPWQADPATVDAFFADLPAGQKVVIAGHSAGGGVALDLAVRNPGQISAAVVVNPAGGPLARVPVPTLLLHGTHDGYRPGDRGKNVFNVEVKGGDHSLRFRDPRKSPSPADKEAADGSDATRTMNQKVGEDVRAFFEIVES